MINALSLRARLTLWYTVVLVVVLSLFGADVLLVERRLGLSRMDQQLDELHTTISNVVRSELEEGVTPASAAAEARDTVAAPGAVIAIVDEGGRELAVQPSGVSLHDLLRTTPDSAPRTVQASEGPWRVHTKRESFKSAVGELRLVVVVGRPLSDLRREQRSVRDAMLAGFPVALLLAGAGGLWLAAVGLRPISRMAAQAARMQPNDMEDLGETDRHDELGQFARAFNALVARLRAALKAQRQFTADASHELRTPISIVRTAADVALARNHRDESDYRESLAIIREESQRLSRLVEDMLVLARADAGGYQLRPTDLYLDDVVADCRRAVAVVAAEREVTVHAAASDAVPYYGDESLLRQLVLNLLQNAVQHTRRGGGVSIEVQGDSRHVAIRVADGGPGIAVADQGRIFDRFVQLDPARSGSGAGLGLPIARWIAEAHGGTLVLEASGPDGSVFCASLPPSSREASTAVPHPQPA